MAVGVVPREWEVPLEDLQLAEWVAQSKHKELTRERDLKRSAFTPSPCNSKRTISVLCVRLDAEASSPFSAGLLRTGRASTVPG